MTHEDLKLQEGYMISAQFVPSKELINVVDKFLDKFLEAALKLSGEPASLQGNSYVLNYTLPLALLHCKHAEHFIDTDNRDYIPPGFVQEFIRSQFGLSMRDIMKDILFIIQNYKDQSEYEDCKVTNVKRVVEQFAVENYAGKKRPSGFKERTVISYSQNSRNTRKPKVVATFIDKELHTVDVFTKKGVHIIKIDKWENASATAIYHAVDINGFLVDMQQIIYGIREVQGEEF